MDREKKGGLGDGAADLFRRADGNHRPYEHYGVATVLESDRKLLLLDKSPLAPSRPGCAGDQGTIGGVRVVDVLEEPGGILHVLAEPERFGIGQYVAIRRDACRRFRLENAHAATLACRAELATRGIGVASAEVAAGLSWIETEEPVYRLDFDLLDGRDEKIEVHRVAGGRMLVEVGGQMLYTPRSPIAPSTGSIGPVGVRAVAALDDGHEALEIALVDHPGREWWR